jgi:putative endonuclease
MAEHNEIGEIGENITVSFLMKHGFTILSTNYRSRYGEIDIIAQKDTVLHFIEVKSVKVRGVNHTKSLHVKPEDNLTAKKWGKFTTTVELYLKHIRISHETTWYVDLACVYIDTEKKEGRVVLMGNIHKE